jgi:SAM-dependent methyltransferase
MNRLTELAIKYNTDKGPNNINGEGHGHSFTDIYPNYLPESPKKMLEIGVRWGESIRMWNEYWPNIDTIYGLDFCVEMSIDKLKEIQKENKKYKFFYADQSNRAHLNEVVKNIGEGTIDFIIDDGSHMVDHQQISLANLFCLLKPGGLYIIEDLTDKIYPCGGWGIKDMVNYTDATVNVLDNFINTRKFTTPYLELEEISYLEKNIDYIELNLRTAHNTSFIFKK